MSVRLKLTLSYAGFLMVAGALSCSPSVWVFLLRYVPDGAITSARRVRARTAPTSCAAFAPGQRPS